MSDLDDDYDASPFANAELQPEPGLEAPLEDVVDMDDPDYETVHGLPDHLHKEWMERATEEQFDEYYEYLKDLKWENELDVAGIDRELISVDSEAKRDLRRLDPITVVTEDHETLELDYDEALKIARDLWEILLDMMHERTRFTVPEYCPMCEWMDHTPAAPEGVDQFSGVELMYWLEEEHDVHVTPREAAYHYKEHIHHRFDRWPSEDEAFVHMEGDDGEVEVVPINTGSDSLYGNVSEVVEDMEKGIDVEAKAEYKATDLQKRVVESLEWRGVYTVTELADAAGCSRRSLYGENIEELKRSGVLRELPGSPQRFEATGECLFPNAEAPSHPSRQVGLARWGGGDGQASPLDFA